MSPEPPVSDVSRQRFSRSGAFDQTTPLLGNLVSLSLPLPPFLLLPTMHKKAMNVKGQQTTSWKRVLGKVVFILFKELDPEVVQP